MFFVPYLYLIFEVQTEDEGFVPRPDDDTS